MADRADFAAAVRALAAEERRGAGDHPPAEEIAAYAAGTLAPARAEALGAHLARCPECADLVLEYGEFVPDRAAGGAGGAEVAAAYGDVRRRLGLPPGRQPGLPEDPGFRRPSAPWLLAAAATLAALGLGIWGWSQQRRLDTAQAPRLNVATVDLDPRGSDRVRGEEALDPLDLASGATLFLALPGMTGDESLRVVVLDADGRAVWALAGGRRDAVTSDLALHLPPGSLAPGSYEIRVHGAGGGPPLAVYPIEVR